MDKPVEEETAVADGETSPFDGCCLKRGERKADDGPVGTNAGVTKPAAATTAAARHDAARAYRRLSSGMVVFNRENNQRCQ